MAHIGKIKEDIEEMIDLNKIEVVTSRPIYKVKVAFSTGVVSDVECNEWPEVRDGWVIIATLDKYKQKAKKRFYYHKDQVVSLTAEILDTYEQNAV